MSSSSQRVFVEIVAKKKGCMLCDLAVAILEEIAEEFEEGFLVWEIVDMGESSEARDQQALADRALEGVLPRQLPNKDPRRRHRRRTPGPRRGPSRA